jgi:drug/metabolite transporter (DMT)-like permease
VPAALLALAGALSWGVGDFLGGLASRRLAVLTVLALSQAVGLAGVALWVVLARDPFPGVPELLPAAAGGLAGIVGLGALYRGMALGAMGIVAPISAASPVVPLAVDAAQGIVPTALQWGGVVLVVAGIATLSREPSSARTGRLAAGPDWRCWRRPGSASSSSGWTPGPTRAHRGRSSRPGRRP